MTFLRTPQNAARVADMLPTQTALPQNSANSARLRIPWAILLVTGISSLLFNRSYIVLP